MLIQSLKVHFSARAMEWLGAATMFTWGYYFVTHPQLLTDPATKEIFTGLVTMAGWLDQSPVAIGLLAIMTGFIRGAALFINGAYTKTPLVRLLTAFLSAFIWTSIVLALYLSGKANTGFVMYIAAIIADVVSGYRAGYDLVLAENVAQRIRSLNGQSTGSERGIFRRLGRNVLASSR